MDLININEFDASYNPLLQTPFALIDFTKVTGELNEKHRKIREALPRGPNYSMRSEAKRLRSLLNLVSKSTWSPKELALAGFFRTGLEESCQCFSCGLVLCNQTLSVTPIEKHQKCNPNCAFIQGSDAGNISKYDIRPQAIELSPKDHWNLMQDEQARLQSFTCWPPYTFMKPDVLVQSGFFFTGTKDAVQCFSCGGCLGNWEENDDPWKEHAKWFPECEFLQSKKSKDEIQQYIENYNGFKGITGASFKNLLTDETGSALSTELLLRGIHHFRSLEEVSIVLPNNTEVIDNLPDDFQTLKRIKKIVFQCSDSGLDSTRFGKFIQSFMDLEVLHLNFKKFLDSNGLINSLTTCKKLKELNLLETPLQDGDMALLASAMKNFNRLKVLNLQRHKIMAKDISETFAEALGSLTQLEKLWLPVGDGMAHAAKLIIKQFRNLPNLQFLVMLEILDDESIAVLGEEANYGNLKKIQRLEVQTNSNITESGWTKFFDQAKDLVELNHLDLSRMYTESIKSHATTVTSFVRFVSRLPSLITLIMYGWLLDKDDLDMFNAMKVNHPQSKSLNIYWQWILPFSPNIKQ